MLSILSYFEDRWKCNLNSLQVGTDQLGQPNVFVSVAHPLFAQKPDFQSYWIIQIDSLRNNEFDLNNGRFANYSRNLNQNKVVSMVESIETWYSKNRQHANEYLADQLGQRIDWCHATCQKTSTQWNVNYAIDMMHVHFNFYFTDIETSVLFKLSFGE